MAPVLGPRLQEYGSDPATVRILIVGCGNAPFSADLYDAGYTNIVNIDYSATVIAHMQELHAVDRPLMQWRVMDMTDLSSVPDAALDVVIDKAAMDALLTHEGDVWHPDAVVVAAVDRMCAHVARVLAPDGTFVQVSLSPPHFRRKYLLRQHASSNTEEEDLEDAVTTPADDDPHYCRSWRWTLQTEPAGRPDDTAGCFGHYLYVMRRRRNV
jgi:EEF1A lysine methyltransferase 4